MAGLLQTFSNPIKYGYATGRVRVLENRMFSMNRLERLIETKDPAERLRVLSETDYGHHITQLSPLAIESGLEEYLGDFYGLVAELAPDAVVRFFRIAYDFHNLKALMKGHILGEPAEDVWSRFGLLDLGLAREAVEADKPAHLPEPYAGAVARALVLYEETEDPQWIDIAVDQALYRARQAIAKELGNPFLIRFARLQTDLANLKVAVRAVLLGRDAEFLRGALMEGGSVPVEQWLALSRQPFAIWVEEIGDHLEHVLNAVLVAGEVEISTLDKASDQYAIDFLRRARYVAVGLEPIVSYVFSKETEVKIIRFVLMAGARGVPVEAVRRKVRELHA